MPESDAFETAYGRLAGTRIVAPPTTGDTRPPSSSPAETPRSRLLPRLALMAPAGRRLPRR